ncbi:MULTISPECIES: hydroxyacid dehydrogenase [Sodalis]|nr:hydroxyacid dehydrogenase [Sodalis ligni]
MMKQPICLITHPIHDDGISLLTAAGVDVRFAYDCDDDALAKALSSADAVITRGEIKSKCIDGADSLAVIANHGSGTDRIDINYAHGKGILVVNTPNCNALSVAEHTLLLMLALSHKLLCADMAARRGDWDFKFTGITHSLSGKSLGIIGFGDIGRQVCKMAIGGFGMQVSVWSPHAHAADITAAGAAPVGSLVDLLANADIISLHRPLRPDTFHTIDGAALGKMKSTALLINTSRGGLIDEDALYQALLEKRIAAAGLDVFEHEPLLPRSRLATLQNTLLTPHIAGSTQEALRKTAICCAEQIVSVFKDIRPPHLLNNEIWQSRRKLGHKRLLKD